MADLRELDAVLSREQTFWKKVNVRGPDECWEWTGTANPGPRPYGKFYISKSRGVRSHRAAYMLTHRSHPGQLFVCHTCDNPRCCNPKHLWLGTSADNNKDRAAKGRSGRQDFSNADYWLKGEQHWAAKLSAADVDAIRQDTRPLKVLAKKYNVSESAISRARHGKSWKSHRALIEQEKQR